MNRFFCFLRLFLLAVAVGLTAYGLTAQFAHGLFFRDGRGQEYRGWGMMWLAMSQLMVVLPSTIAAVFASIAPFEGPRPFLGSHGRHILAVTAIFALLVGILFGWPK